MPSRDNPEPAPRPPVQPPRAQPEEEIQEAKATEERLEEVEPQPATSAPWRGGAEETPQAARGARTRAASVR